MKLFLGLLVLAIACHGEGSTGISGEIEDSSGHALAGAEVQVQSESTGARWKTQADQNGRYSVAPLAPGRYKVTVRMPGFRTVSRVGASVDSGEELRLDFAMEVLALHEVITVTSSPDPMNPSTASSLLVTRESAGATLPANGGDYRVLFDLMPGVVTTPASTSDAGKFTSNGQRPNSNMFRVDGISANTGVGSSILPGAFPGASLPAMTAIGSTENLVSNETAQSVELRTADVAPEFGDRPGAEALVITRAGSNRFHAEFSGHVRDAGWNARDWFANSRALGFPRPSYGRLGMVFGGPIRRNKTFFFLSGEASKLTDTGVQLTSVPSLETRRAASDKLRPILNFYPYPTGPDLGGGEAEGLWMQTEIWTLFSTSLRIDQSLGRNGNLFLRLTESPTRSRTQGNRFNWASGTLGVTLGATGGIHDLRFNYSRSDLLASSYGGGPGYSDAVLAMAGMLPGYTIVLIPDGGFTFQTTSIDPTALLSRTGLTQTAVALSVPGLGQFLSYGWGKARQDQWEFRESFSRTMGRHEFRAGGDYVRLEPSRNPSTYSVLGVAPSLQSLLDNQPLAVTSSSPAQRGGKIHQVSLFVQDSFRPSDTLSLLYGLGWAITPPTAGGAGVPTVSGLWTGTNWLSVYGGIINGAGPWPMRYGQVAPRIGLAYRPPWAGLLLRAGAGMFYDTTLGAAVNPINGAPFNSWLLAGGGSGITSTGPSGGTSPGLGKDSPDVQQFLLGAHPALRLPTSYQWRLSMEKALGSRGVGSVAYLGAAGRHLLGHQAYVDPDTGVLRQMVTLTANSSSHQALQMRYGGWLLRSLYGSLSYTWSHSIDDGSQDSSVFLIHPGYRLSEARGSSSFDARQTLAAAVQYRMPASTHLPPWLTGWSVSGTFRARAGFPIDVLTNDQPLGQGFDNVGRPDRVTGAPIWIVDPSAAGRRRLNSAAFRVPTGGVQGNLGRNSFPGNGLAQVDVSLRREIPLVFGISAEVGLSVFNVVNHPAFADPVPFLSSPWFGQSTSMQNLMLGSGSPNTGLPPLFQTGGARSAEFSFRVSF